MYMYIFSFICGWFNWLYWTVSVLSMSRSSYQRSRSGPIFIENLTFLLILPKNASCLNGKVLPQGMSSKNMNQKMLRIVAIITIYRVLTHRQTLLWYNWYTNIFIWMLKSLRLQVLQVHGAKLIISIIYIVVHAHMS